MKKSATFQIAKQSIDIIEPTSTSVMYLPPIMMQGYYFNTNKNQNSIDNCRVFVESTVRNPSYVKLSWLSYEEEIILQTQYEEHLSNNKIWPAGSNSIQNELNNKTLSIQLTQKLIWSIVVVIIIKQIQRRIT